MNTYLEPGSVLVGVDGSAGSDRAVGWAASFAQHRGRPLAIVAAAGTPAAPDFAWTAADTEEGLLAAAREVADGALGRVRSAHPDLPVTSHVVLGDPRAILAHLAVDASVRSHLLGSVSRSVVEQAHSTVVVVRGSRA